MTKSARAIQAAENERLTALTRLAILDTPSEREFDEITRLAALALGAESCAISLIDDERQWSKSRYGIDATERPRAGSFCTHVLDTCVLVEVPHTHLDDRFVRNPFVTCDDGIRFYASAPLMSSTSPAMRCSASTIPESSSCSLKWPRVS
jgi:GAF domain-containing protein